MSKTRSVKMTNYSRLPRRLQVTLTSMSASKPLHLGFTVFVFFTVLLLLTNFMDVADTKYVESCEKSYAAANPAEISLRCQLRTLNTDFDQLNLSTITDSPPHTIVSLSLLCSHVLFYQSSLPKGSFAKFTGLHTLEIEHCKLSRLEPGVFQGLQLRNLTINTHNTAWPALSLDLSSGVLNAVPTLERIDLSQNNIWTFPDQVFCPVHALEYLNVSLNRLQDIGDLGFREPATEESNAGAAPASCQMSLQVLDISHNRLILLPSHGLSRLEHLQELYVQGNEISVIGNQALGGLKELRLLNLGHNKITSLPEDVFNEGRQLVEIYLQNNSIGSLAAKLFSMLNRLQVLDLSHNSLTTLESILQHIDQQHNNHGHDLDVVSVLGQFDSSNSYHLLTDEPQHHVESPFAGLGRLVFLNLGHNQLDRIQANAFQELFSLQVLNLEHNQIRTIEANAFASLTNLHTLILSHNLLSFVDASSLNGLAVLGQLSIDNNNLTGIHRDAFHNCSALKDLNVNGNALTADVQDAIQNLTHLKTIDLGENQLESVPRLLGLPNLYGLRLTGNQIVNVSKDAFQELASLKILNLARNQLKSIEEGTFDSSLNLQALRLDANYLTDISNLFTQSPNLIWLNISDNQLTWFDYTVIPKQLQWLDLHKNALGDLGNYFKIQDLKLTTLDASYNRITSLGAANLPDSLEMVFLNDNLIRTIEPHTFLKKVNLSRIDLFANQIESLELTSLRLGPISPAMEVPEMYLAGNPILCDCNSEWLQRINRLDHLRQYFRVPDLENVYCRIVNEDTVLPITHVQPSQFLCPYTNHCFNLCECCDYSACDCQQQCPQNCDCFNDDIWATNIVDCSNRGHTKMPMHIPMDASQLYLDGNTIDDLPSLGLIGMKNLLVLHLNNSGISGIANNSLSGLKRLETLHLENNFIQRLEGFEFHDLTELKELYLQNNKLSFISNNTFQRLSQLEVLRLDHNKLTHFHMWTLTENSNLVAINLAYNEWSCECEFLAQAMPWTRTNIAKLDNPGSLTCNLYGRSFSLLYMNGTRCLDVNPAPDGRIPKELESSDMDSGFVPLLLICITLFVLIVGVVIFVSRRWHSKTSCMCSWLHANFSPCSSLDIENGRQIAPQNGNGFTACDENGHELYDAYLCCSWKDEAWAQVLQHTLASSTPSYRICLNYELSKATQQYPADMIIEGAQSSKRVVLVLSPNFLQHEWCQLEFRSALCTVAYALHASASALIIIGLGDLGPILDPDLQILLRSSIVLSVDDKQFMTKFRAALPPPSQCQPQSYSTSLPVSRSPSQEHKDEGLYQTYSTGLYHQIQYSVPHFINNAPRRPPPPLPPIPTPTG